jgi:hypothetical protein
MPANTYYVKIAYRSGGGTSVASGESSVTLGTAGKLVVSTPSVQTYAYSYDVYLSAQTGSGPGYGGSNNEVWLANCLVGKDCSFTSSATMNQVFTDTPPTVATPVPAIILHTQAGSGIISEAGGKGFHLIPTPTAVYSDEIDTEDMGDPIIQNLYLGNYLPAGETVTDAVIRIQSVFSQSVISGIHGYCDAPTFMKIIQSNDVTFDHMMLGAGITATNCLTLLDLSDRTNFSDRSDHNANLNFPSMSLFGVPNGATFIKTNGNYLGAGYNADDPGFVFTNTTFENTYNSSNLTGIVVDAMTGVNLINPKFSLYSTGTNNTAVLLKESGMPCMTRDFRVTDPRILAGSTGSTFIQDNITNPTETIIPPAGGWIGGQASYYFGTSPTDNCPQYTTNYVRGTTQNTDTTSEPAAALTAAGPSSLASANLVLNPQFVGGSTVATNWSSLCSVGSCTFLVDSGTAPPTATSSQKLTIGTVGFAEVKSSAFSVTSGAAYIFNFWAKDDGTSTLTQVEANVTDAAAGGTIVCLARTISISATWTKYSVPCTAIVSGTSSQVWLYTPATTNIGAGSVWFGNVQFALAAGTTPPFAGFGSLSQFNGIAGDGIVDSATPRSTLVAINAAQNSVLAGPATGGAGVPSYQTAPTIAVTNMTGTGAFNTSGSAGSATTATNISTSGTANQVWGMNSGATAQGWQTVSGGSGTVNSGTQWSPAFYAATGTAVSGTTPFTGLEYWSGSGAPGAATAAQVVGVISTTAVANATATVTATNLAGGAVGSLPNQSAAGTTAFIASPTTTGHTFVPAWQPSGSAIQPIAIDANTLAVGSAATATTATTASGLAAGTQIALTAPSTAIANLTAGPTITQGGTPATSVYCYGVVARNTAGTVYTAISTNVCTALGAATLNSTNYNIVTFPSLPANANCFDVYRLISLGSPTSQGKIASCQTTSYNDQGASGSGVPPYYANWMPNTSGLPAGCLQFPCVVASETFTGLTVTTDTTGGYIPVFTPSALGVFNGCGELTITTIGNSVTAQPNMKTAYLSNIYYIAEGHTVAVQTANNSTSSSSTSNCQEFQQDSGTAISEYVHFSSGGGSVVYTLHFSLTQVQ